jgi:flagellar biosynthesis protein FlhG
VLFFVGMAQEVVLVLSPEPTSLVDAYAVVKVLSQQAGIRNFAVVINPVVDEMPARDMFQKPSTVTGRFLTAKLRHLGYVPRDENVETENTIRKILSAMGLPTEAPKLLPARPPPSESAGEGGEWLN